MQAASLGVSLLALAIAFRVWWLMESLTGWLQDQEETPEVPVVPLSERERSYQALQHVEDTMSRRSIK